MNGRVEPARLVYLYVVVLGAGLLLEGAALLLVDRLGLPLGISTNDARHNLLHIVWGLALLALALATRGTNWVAWAGVVFGVFYISLGVLGLLLDQPLGLLLGPAENAFHFTVGPLALVLGIWALKSSSDSSAWTSGAGRGGGAGSSAR